MKYSYETFTIGNESQSNFTPKDYRELTDFEQWALKIAGDSIRPRRSQHFWSDGSYCWYTNEHQDHIERLWIAETGQLILETSENYYRVLMNN